MAMLIHHPLDAGVYVGPTTDETFEQLLVDVETRVGLLTAKISEATAAGLNTDYANVSLVTINNYKDGIALWDRENLSTIEQQYSRNGFSKNDPVGPEGLPFDQLADCVEVADEAIDELQRQIDGDIVLQNPKDFSTGNTVLNGNVFKLDGETVIPSKFFWGKNDDATGDFYNAYGHMGERYLSVIDLATPTSVGSGRNNALKTSIAKQVEQENRVPIQFFLGHIVPNNSFLRTDFPEAFETGYREFTEYDFDNPNVREWMDTLITKQIGDARTVAGPDVELITMLSNEPNYAIKEGGRGADHGVSSFTMDKYAAWLESKYGDIASLNAIYGTTHVDFESVKTTYTIPLDTDYRGGPVWYDWLRFNMDRANEWFTFLNDKVKEADPLNLTHVKMWGEGAVYTDYADEGIDFEYLIDMLDIPGTDNQVTPFGAEWDVRFYQDWRSRYIFDWRSSSINIDFVKSLAPNKPFFDSEYHGLHGGRWVDFHMDAEFVRASIWQAAAQGMGVMNAWLYNRRDGGSAIRSTSYVGTSDAQPIEMDAFGRVFKELNAHGETVASLHPSERTNLVYYSRDASIQDANYPKKMADVWEALRILNIPNGFTTARKLNLVSSDQTVIVPPTEHISDADLAGLKAFEAAGGTLVFVQADSSFVKTELGLEQEGIVNFSPFATIEFGDVYDMADALKLALVSREPTMPVNVSIEDVFGDTAYGVLSSQYTDPDTGENVVYLVNVSQEKLKVTLRQGDGVPSVVTNLIDGGVASHSMSMAPYDVLLLQASVETIDEPTDPGPGDGEEPTPPVEYTFDFSQAPYVEGALAGQDNWIGGTHAIAGGLLDLNDLGDWSDTWQDTGLDTSMFDEFCVSATFRFSETGPHLNGKQFMNIVMNDETVGTTQLRARLSRNNANNYLVSVFTDTPGVQVGFTTFSADKLGFDIDADVDLDSDLLKMSLTVKKGATANDWVYTLKIDNLSTNTNAVTASGILATQEAMFTASTLYGGINNGQIVGAGVENILIEEFGLCAAQTVFIDPNNQAPYWVFDSVTKRIGNVNAPYSGYVAVDARDPESDPLTFSKISGPDWLIVDANGSLSGTPLESDMGANVFTLQVDAIGGSDTITLNIAVEEELPPPPPFVYPTGPTMQLDFSDGYVDGLLAGQNNWISGNHEIDDSLLRLSESGDFISSYYNVPLDAANNEVFTVAAAFFFSETGGYENGKQFMNVILNDGLDGSTQFRARLSRAGQNDYAVSVFSDTPGSQFGYTSFKADLIGLDLNANSDLDSDALVMTLTMEKGATASDWTYTIRIDNYTTGLNAVTSTGTLGSQEDLFNSTTMYGGINGGQIVDAGVENRVVYGVTIEAGLVVVNLAPSFSSDTLDKEKAALGVEYNGSLTSDASDPEGDVLNFSKITGPAWLVVGTDGTLSGTPTEGDLGVNMFTVQVETMGGNYTATVNILVEEPLPPAPFITYDFSSGYVDGALGGQNGWKAVAGGHSIENGVMVMNTTRNSSSVFHETGIAAADYESFMICATFSFSETGSFSKRTQFMNLLLNDKTNNGTPFRARFLRNRENEYQILVSNDSGTAFGTVNFSADLIGLDVDANDDLDSDTLEYCLEVERGETMDDWAFSLSLKNVTAGGVVVAESEGSMSSQEAMFTAPVLFGGVAGTQIDETLFTNRKVYSVKIGGRVPGQEVDTDDDGIIDSEDNCPTTPNPDQVDLNGDGFGDDCVSTDIIVDDSSFIGYNPMIDCGTLIEANVVIGENSLVGKRVRFGVNTMVGDNLTVGDDTKIRNDVVLGNNVFIGSNVSIEAGAVIEDGVTLEDGVKVGIGALVGADSTLGAYVAVIDGDEIAANSNIAAVENPCSQKGDLDCDGFIGRSDIIIFRDALGASECDERFKPELDYDNDGYISRRDYSTWRRTSNNGRRGR